MKGYTTREVAEVLGLPTSRIQGWTRSGLLTPERDARGAWRFSFQDIVLLRTACELLEQNVPTRRVREALEALRTQLPVGRPLSAVHVSALGEQIIVHDDDTVWEPNSGQIQIDFSVAEVARSAEPVARRALEERAEEPELTADDWYDTALDLESVATDEAVTAYRRVIAIAPAHAEAHINLGRLLHEAGDVPDAESHYRQATVADPQNARAFYNLGVALEDQGLHTGALEAYRRSLMLDPRLAAAHFNASRLLEARDDRADALRHLAAYKRLIEQGPGID